MDLFQTYKAVLKTAMLTTSEDGYVYSEVFGEKEPFTIGGKRLVLPTNEHLRNPDKESRIMFHPLRENPMHYGESEVLSSFRNALNTRLNASIALLSLQLIDIASTVPKQKALNPDQAVFLSEVKTVDEKKESFNRLAKITAAMPLGQTSKAFVSIYLKKGGKIDGVKYKKAAIVSFPLYEELLKDEGEVYGVKIRQKDKTAYINLLEYLFEDIGTPNAYSAGSNSDVAPSLECIMGALKKIGTAINDQAELFKGVITDSNEIVIDSEWVDYFINIERLVPEINRILPQFGNEPKDITEPAPAPSATSVSTKPIPVIPVSDKLEFAGLGHTGAMPAFQNSPSFQQPVSQNKTLSLSDAFGGGNYQQNRIGLTQSGYGANSNMTTVGFNNQPGFGFNTPFGYNTGSSI